MKSFLWLTNYAFYLLEGVWFGFPEPSHYARYSAELKTRHNNRSWFYEALRNLKVWFVLTGAISVLAFVYGLNTGLASLWIN